MSCRRCTTAGVQTRCPAGADRQRRPRDMQPDALRKLRPRRQSGRTGVAASAELLENMLWQAYVHFFFQK